MRSIWRARHDSGGFDYFRRYGDLSARKLFPALYQLDAAGLLQADLRIAAIGRQQQSVEDFKNELRQKMAGYMREPIDESVWQRFVPRLDYLASDFAEPDAFLTLRDWLDDSRVSLFYLATPPSLFSTICEQLARRRMFVRPVPYRARKTDR